VQRAPGLPCALFFGANEFAKLGRSVSRERGVMSRTINVIARSACDEAIQLLLVAWIASLTLAKTVLDVLFES
jgi:hypothetical protein